MFPQAFVPFLVFCLSINVARCDEPDFVDGVLEPTLLQEVETLRARLQATLAELEGIRSAPIIQSASWLQGDGASDGGSGGGDGGGDLASKSQNPISSLVSLPLQSNFDFGLDPSNRTRYVGNLQPVVPVKFNDDWNLINRVIVPFVNLPIGSDMRSDGIGDSLGQFFFSPRDPGDLIWGVGPAVLFPTASDSSLGFQEWGAGVTAVGLISEGPIVAGLLGYQIWSVDGSTKPFLLQPFFNYNLPKGWFVSVSGEANADWEQIENRRWTIVAGPGIGRVFPIFGQPMNIATRFGGYLDGPPGGPDWQFRLTATLLFPK